MLREQVVAALERRTSTPVTAISGSEPVVKRLREVSARLERQSRELMSLQDHRSGIVEAGIAAVTGLYVDAAGGPPPARDAIRIALIRPTEILAGQLAKDLNACAREVQSALAAAVAILGVAAPAVDFPGLTQEIPMLDVPPVNLELKPPVWTRTGGFVRRKWFDDHVRQPLQPTLDSAAAAYLDVLKKWANDSLARIRREFESQSRPLLSQLTPSTGPAQSGGEALKRDLAQLRGQRIEVSHVPD